MYWRRLVVILSGLLLLAILGWWYLTSAAFWHWLGWRLVAALQERLNAELQVRAVAGNLLTGLSFRDIRLIRGEETILTLAELEISLSPLSLLRLEPVIGTLVLRQPRLRLTRDATGQWNVTGLLKKRPPPPFARLHCRQILLEDGQLRLRRPAGELLLTDLELRLRLTVISPGRPEARLQVPEITLAFTYPSLPRLTLTGSLTYSAQALDIDQLQLALAGLVVARVRGQVQDPGGQPVVTGQLTLGPLEGGQLRQLVAAWPPELDLEGSLSFAGASGDWRLEGGGCLRQTAWAVKAFWPSREGAASLRLDFRQLTPAVLARLVRLPQAEELTPLSGRLDLTANLQAWPPAAGRLLLTLEPWRWRQAEVTATRLELGFAGSGPQQGRVKLAGNFGQLEALVTGRFLPWPGAPPWWQGNLALKVQDFQPARWWPQAEPLTIRQGDLQGDFQLPAGQWRQAAVSGRFRAAGQWRHLVVRELVWQGAWQEERLQWQILQLGGDWGQLNSTGWLSRAGVDLRLAFNLRLPLPDVGPTTLTGGSLRGNLALAGPWRSPNYHLDLTASELKAPAGRARRLQLQAWGSWQTSRPLPHFLQLQAEKVISPLGSWPQLSLSAQGEGQSLAFVLAAQEEGTQQGEVRGRLLINPGGWELQLHQGRWSLASQELQLSHPGRFRFSRQGLEEASLQGRWGAAAFSVQGHATLDRLQGTIQVSGLSLAQLGPPGGAGLLQGRLELLANLAGTPRNPQISVNLGLSQARLAGRNLQTCNAALVYRERLLTVSAAAEEQPDGARLVGRGRLPLELQLWPWRWHLPPEPLQARLTSERLDLALLAALVPQISQAAGPLALDLQLGGTWRQPELTGGLKWQEATLTVKSSGARLHLSPGELHLAGDRLVLPPVLVLSGDGSATLQGGSRLQGLWPQEAAFTLTLTDFLVIDRAGSRATANGRVELVGSWPTFRLQGQVTATGGHFRLAFFRSDKRPDIILLPRHCELPQPAATRRWLPEVLRNFTLALTVDIPGDVWLRDKDLQAEIAGRLTVNRQPGQPLYLGGALQARKGTVLLANKPFTLDRAVLLFPNEPRKPAVLEARATRRVEEVTLALTASGPVTSLRTRIDSTPPLPPRDVLSLLVFDRLAGKMTREEYLTVSQRAMGLIGGFTMERLKALLSGAVPLVGELTPATSQDGVGVGTKVGKDITISYERKLNPLQGEDVNQLRLHYRLHKYFSVETQIGRRNSGGDLFFNLDF